MHGKGIFTWSDGRKYTGEVINLFTNSYNSMLMIKKRGMESLNGVMEKNMKDNG